MQDMAGTFIVIDGNDGSGKATQTKLLCDRLQKEGIAYEKIDFPQYDNNFFGTFIGECLAGKHGDFAHLDPGLASLPYALDRLETSPKIKEWLAAGKVVIADRFTSANQIHQGGKIVGTEKRDAFLKWLDQMEHEVLGIPRPTAVIYLRVPVETSLALLSKKREAKNAALGGESHDTVEKDKMYLERSVESAEILAKTNAGWHQVECIAEGGMRTPEAIHEDVYRIVTTLL
jgi:dTMP kinase